MDEIDIWWIARSAEGIAEEIYLKYKSEFDAQHYWNTRYHKYSDWYDHEEEFLTGWQNLGKNDSLVITTKLIDELKNLNTTITISEGDARDGFSYFKKEVNVWNVLI
ncbi:MAG: hypothetical protein ABI763_13210 [Bacteroidota bacterium]